MNEITRASLSLLFGLGLLTGGAELLVRGASSLARSVRISPLVIGLTIVAYGTSCPELAVSLQAALAGNADLSVGNVVGSNIFNVLFILGISALIIPLVVSSRLVRWDVPLMIAVSLVLLALGLDHRISRLEGLLLFLGLLGYTWQCIYQSRKENKEVQDEFAREWPAAPWNPGRFCWYLLTILGGLGLLILGASWLIEGAVFIARSWGVSELVIGLTLVAGGTSLPELVTSIVAALRGERDIAIGNVVGSNIFNILGVLGIASCLSPEGLPVSSDALSFDFPVMIAVAIACLPIFFTGYLISRWEGLLFLFYYTAYTIYLITGTTVQEVQFPIQPVLVLAVVPLTVLPLSSMLWRCFQQWSSSTQDRQLG